MKRTIIITDLTRFKEGNPSVCVAGIDRATGECFRPMPYLSSVFCRRLKILPGGILSGDLEFAPNRTEPHVEDCKLDNLTFHGPCSSDEFRAVLAGSCFPSLEEGFEISLPHGEKAIPKDHQVKRSIITLRVSPSDVSIVENTFNPGSIKLNFRDQSGRGYRYFPITDLGFHDYALKHRDQDKLVSLNRWISTQAEVYLRIGLSRNFKNAQGKEGFWLQGNGIYTFPHAAEGVRGYAS